MTAQCTLNTKREIDDNQLRFIALLLLRVDATQMPHHDQAEVPQQAPCIYDASESSCHCSAMVLMPATQYLSHHHNYMK